jgi:hypothetical protein
VLGIVRLFLGGSKAGRERNTHMRELRDERGGQKRARKWKKQRKKELEGGR